MKHNLLLLDSFDVASGAYGVKIPVNSLIRVSLCFDTLRDTNVKL
jgi:hypothetical protein